LRLPAWIAARPRCGMVGGGKRAGALLRGVPMEKVVVQVAMAATDLEALVYQRLLRDKGIPSILLDAEDNPYVPGDNIGRKVENLKVLTLVHDEKRALEIIKDFENKKDTRTISKSGEHVMFQCPACSKHLCFPARDAGSRQICGFCRKIVEVPVR
jgi:hypothetical protein